MLTAGNLGQKGLYLSHKNIGHFSRSTGRMVDTIPPRQVPNRSDERPSCIIDESNQTARILPETVRSDSTGGSLGDSSMV